MSVRANASTTSMTAAGSANSAVTITVTGVSGMRAVISSIQFSYSTTPTGTDGLCLVSMASATVFQLETNAGGVFSVNREFRGAPGETATITLEAGGGAASALLNADFYYSL